MKLSRQNSQSGSLHGQHPGWFVLSTALFLFACGSTSSPPATSSPVQTPPPLIAVALAPASGTVPPGGSLVFTATVSGAGNATPAVTWSVNGAGGGNVSLGTIVATASLAATTTALYTAPLVIPSPATVTITATSVADSSKAASSTVTIAGSIPPSVTISVSPQNATVITGQRVTLTPTVSNTSDTSVSWFANGIANGNASVGLVCLPGSNPCVPPAAPATGAVDYLAPALLPASNPVSLTAVSHADPTRGASAVIFVVAVTGGSISISLSPSYVFMSTSAGSLSRQQFSATITGTANTGVTWTVQSGIANLGCGSVACGSISASGLYAAPALTPSPNAVTIVATSQADPTKSASAAVAFTTGPLIETLLPSSVLAGTLMGFPLSIEGANFIAGSGGSSSTVLISGAPRATTCASTTVCTVTLNPADVQSPGSLTIQVSNPDPPVTLSNPAPFVIAPLDLSQSVIALTSADPAATSENIAVVEPSNAAASSPLSVEAVGYLTGGNNCGIQGSPLSVSRPTSGSTTASICIFGAGLDATLTYAFTSPDSSPPDIGVTASNVPSLLPGLFELDLQISSTTTPGLRSLFITNLNNDRAVASGVLEVQ